MKKITCLPVILLMLFSFNVHSANLEGSFDVYDPAGLPIIQIPVTGEVDIDNGVLVFDEFMFFGSLFSTSVLEILPPGNYDRTFNGTIISAIIPVDTVGAYMVSSWLGNEFPVFMAWEITSSNTIFNPVDLDGDGIPGMALLSGPFVGFSPVFGFTADPSGPGVKVLITVDGGIEQECTGYDGTEVSMTAVPTLFGGATLASIDWTIDDASAGSGMMITQTLALGEHDVEVLAMTTSGETGSSSTIVSVEDTSSPQLQINFVDNQNNIVEHAGNGPVQLRMTATDTCDPDPVISDATMTPSFSIANYETLQINASKANLKLPTTSLRASASATDDTGNTIYTYETLHIDR